MTRESEAEEPNKGCSSSMASWCVVMAFLAAAAGLGVWAWNMAQDQKVREGKLTTELADVKGKLVACERKPATVTPCDKEATSKPHRHKPPRHRYQVPKPPKSVTPPPPPVPAVKAPVEESKFDPSTCGEGTEPVISRTSGKPYCRAIPVPASAAPAVQPRMTEYAPRASRDCYRDEYGRLMCRGGEARSSGSSWVPWAIGGAGLLAIIANDRRHHHDAPPVSAPQPVAPPVWVTNPGNGSPPPVLVTNPGTNRVPPTWVTN